MTSSRQEIPLTSPRRSNFTESTSKPIIVIVSPTTPAVSEADSPPSSPSSQEPSSPPPARRSSYTSLLAKISRDAHILTITSLESLEETLTQHGPKIAGFIISSTAILHPIHHALAMRLAELAHNNHTEPPTNPPTTSASNPTPSSKEEGSERGRRIYTIIFALSFASTAISTPLLFASFMRTIFHLPWRLSGMTNQKVKTKLRASVLRKLGQRVYRVRYCFRSVFLRNVKLADKVVVATGEFPVGGQRVSTTSMGVDVAFWLGDGSGDFDDDDGDEDGYGEGGDGTETASTDEEMEEDWQSEESEGTAVGGDFGDGYSFLGEEGEYLQGGSADLVVNGDGDAAMQVDEDAGFLADVEDNEVDGLDVHPIVTTTFVVGNHVNSGSVNMNNGAHQVDDVFSDNSTFLSPTSLLTNSPAATVSTPATTTVASSFEEDDEEDDDDEEAETALAAGTIIQTIEGEEDLDDSEDLDMDFNLSTTHIHAHITNHNNNNNNPSLNLLHATNYALNLTTPNTTGNYDSDNNEENITPPPPLHPTDTDWVPSDDEGTSVDLCCADSPIVIHEFKRTVLRDDGVQEKVPCGYVGFVGHVDDSRSMSTLILGMCAVPKLVEDPSG
ncbi:uncharacterized protein LDX57_006233 [Aspergillus melleus]|uniref:uncharacterized protein n=1 Tax=Aspergillus melleus TaxID=138277 RepID=UPI001E8CB44B|nr:uncharacterized protein LDX57_006233 [Aspergillus melleus]KAH8428537.1 hypothetical protein LDX57_006233 [Aspergillus melleus]